ncbi:MAG: ABC transporter ATP-binding protein [Planctomycetes bacterium]|nr:ABC transporter ATP-binding protein [Planctomycetota bacterium]
MTNAIEFRGVRRHFGQQEVLRGLELAVKPGEVFALLGRNGSGKTTALRILLGFLKPHEGEAFILGRPSAALTSADRERIGYVAEGQHLYPELRVCDLLRFEAETRTRFEPALAERELARAGLPLEKHVWHLSRGQRAQVALILVAATSPEVLVFDDPAMGLDVVMRRQLLDTLIELLAERGCAVLFSSHILTDVERIADRVGILHGGALIVDAPLDELKRRVQKRQWIPRKVNGHGAEPLVDGLLRARKVSEAYELTLLDLDEAREATLRAGATHVSEPLVPDLEELFLDLTTGTENSR